MPDNDSRMLCEQWLQQKDEEIQVVRPRHNKVGTSYPNELQNLAPTESNSCRTEIVSLYIVNVF